MRSLEEEFSFIKKKKNPLESHMLILVYPTFLYTHKYMNS